jgi:acetylornithine deacetylase/succinyl-diaminopimelate desuccinylase-like protein
MKPTCRSDADCAHGDVVGVEREKWSLDPFAGATRDGRVCGRGAID